MDKLYKVKIGDFWLREKDICDDKDEADTFENKTEPTQIIDQMKKEGFINKDTKIEFVELKESIIDEKDKAWGEGYKAAGEDYYKPMRTPNPYKPGTDLYRYWQNGYNAGKEDKRCGWYNESVRGKVEIEFADIQEANKFKKEIEKRFEDKPGIYVSSNFKLPIKEKRVMNFERNISTDEKLFARIEEVLGEVCNNFSSDEYEFFASGSLGKNNRFDISISVNKQNYFLKLGDAALNREVQKWQGNSIDEFDKDFEDLISTVKWFDNEF